MRVELHTEGSMFTREFYVTFTAPMADINAWIAASPGTRDVTPEPDGYGSMVYKIKPGGGAQFAEVLVDPKMQTVAIHAFWS